MRRAGSTPRPDFAGVSARDSTTTPEIIQIALPQTAVTIDPRNDSLHLTTCACAKAMQLAIDLKGIAKDY